MKNKPNKLPQGVTLLPSGNYRRRFYLNGKRVSDSDSDLDALMTRTDALMKSANDRTPAWTRRYTVREFYNAWVKSFRSRSVRNTTISSDDSRYYSQIDPVFGTKYVDSLGPFEINDFYFNMLDNGLSVSYANNVFTLFSSMLEAAISLNVIPANPCKAVSIRNPVKENGDTSGARALTQQEIRLFFHIIRDAEYCDMLKVMFLTGLRIGEVSALRFSDIDGDFIHVSSTLGRVYSETFDKVCCFLHSAKTFSGKRTLPLTEKLHSIFQEQRALYEKARKIYGEDWGNVTVVSGNFIEDETESIVSDFIFLTKKGSAFVATTINSSIESRIQRWNSSHKEQLSSVSTHDLRDTYASLAYAMNIDPLVLERLMGHTSFKTTDKSYIDIENEKFMADVSAYNYAYRQLIEDL